MISAINHTLQSKLQSLLSFLRQITVGFDTVAEEIDSINLKTAMIAVAVESKQYAKEISDQLQHFNIVSSKEHTDKLWEGIEVNVHEQASFEKGGEITALCNNCEIYFGKLYEDVLQEYFPYRNLKDIITYQLFAIQCAFSKIRLLNTLRFSQQETFA
jgi:hypothetical protein